MKRGFLIIMCISVCFLIISPSLNQTLESQSIKNSIKERINKEITEEAEEYLFQTIIDVANNPDVNDILKQNITNKFVFDYDFKGIYSELIVKNPDFANMVITKPSISHDYLDKLFDIGVDMIDILGEEQVYEIMDTILISNTEVTNKVKNIIFNDAELSNRTDILFDLVRLIVCLVLLALLAPVAILYSIFDTLYHCFIYSYFFTILYAIFGIPLLGLGIALLGLTGAICLEYETCFSK